MIKVAVAGCAGRMGRTVCDAVRAANDMELVCGIDRTGPRSTSRVPDGGGRARVLDGRCARRLHPASVVADNLREALPAGVDCVVGTTGLSNETLQELAALAPDGTCLFYAPNFTTGAVLMMEFAKPPRRTSRRPRSSSFTTATRRMLLRVPRCARRRSSLKRVAGARAKLPARRPRSKAPRRARRARGRRAGAFRALDGLRRSQEVIFGSLGQTLSIRHDSWDRTSYMPGVLLGIRSVGSCDGLVVGLENFMA